MSVANIRIYIRLDLSFYLYLIKISSSVRKEKCLLHGSTSSYELTVTSFGLGKGANLSSLFSNIGI